MLRGYLVRFIACHFVVLTATPARAADPLDDRFPTQVRPFLDRYCLACHGAKKQEASLDLSRDTTVAAIVKNAKHWDAVLERVVANEMPPEDAARQPKPDERAAVVAWLRELRTREANRNAGDPGVVLARRLSNAEYDATVRDLTGADIRPTREFPVDPANQAGFDNSGESLAMSPALVKKYLAAARQVADHAVLTPDGIAFAPHPAVTDTDRDKYVVRRILDFYASHRVDLAEYFFAAWQKKHGHAPDAKLSPTYIALVSAAMTEPEAEVGPLAEVRKLWNALPANAADARKGCEGIRDTAVRLRKSIKSTIKRPKVSGISDGSQPFLTWRNRELAANRRTFTGTPDKDVPLAAMQRFCSVFPDVFVVTEPSSGRPLTAGFHLMQGYFRDDRPLYDLILTADQRREIDAMWFELDFVASAVTRQYKDFIFFERAEPPQFIGGAEFDFARSEDKDATTEAKMKRLADAYLAKAKKNKADAVAVEAIERYFAEMSAAIRKVERARLAAEPRQLDALVAFAERAYRRPITKAERDDIRAFHRTLREQEGLTHEDALRDGIVAVLMSPHFGYRFDLAAPGTTTRPLTDVELANRLSYFLWSSMPDAELLARAAAGDLHRPEVLIAQTRRMLADDKVRGLATEFGGNWLDFRRFEEHNGVDRERFPMFTNELRQAMFEEPVRFLSDIAKRNRSVLELVYGGDTFVNRPLARHYGMPSSQEAWTHVTDAGKFGRGGLLPMAVFQTANAPGLRTSPVKRGYWVVRRLLGEEIPPPPPTVAELPKDEANLGELSLPQLLARHRGDKNCAACHARFDSMGLAFEGFGPVGERRTKDLGGKPVAVGAAYPDGKEREGVAGVQSYIREKRQEDFVENLCEKLFTFALGRTLVRSDEPAVAAMKAKLKADEHRFGTLIEAIVTSRQFLNKRGGDDTRE